MELVGVWMVMLENLVLVLVVVSGGFLGLLFGVWLLEGGFVGGVIIMLIVCEDFI